MIGLRGIKVDRSAQIADAWRAAFAADRPVVINAVTDPEEPPIPPHVTLEQAMSMGKAFVKAPKEGLPGAVQAAKQFAKEFKPGQ
jgi:pyruvate dehydrogenase (quinone)